MKLVPWPLVLILVAAGLILSCGLHAGLEASAEAEAVALASSASANPPAKPPSEIYAERKALLDQASQATGIPWTYLAAVDQYERSLSIANPKKRPPRKGLIGIYYSEPDWAGYNNPNPNDTDIRSIAIFGGLGRDGSGDGLADRNNDLDLLSTASARLSQFGTEPEQLRQALQYTYKTERAMERLDQFIRIYETFGRLDLHEHAFPLPVQSVYSYRGTWGAARSWGGYRMHEGTDLFAGHGVPVRSTCYGIVEIKGWNNYGGWRIGLRDLNNVYHYYAHLSGYEKSLKQGDIVTPGQALGWVGSSGYGKPGTQGKFPPHLHYGLYRDNGTKEWSFDPYPSLRKWEREDKQRGKAPAG